MLTVKQLLQEMCYNLHLKHCPPLWTRKTWERQAAIVLKEKHQNAADVLMRGYLSRLAFVLRQSIDQLVTESISRVYYLRKDEEKELARALFLLQRLDPKSLALRYDIIPLNAVELRIWIMNTVPGTLANLLHDVLDRVAEQLGDTLPLWCWGQNSWSGRIIDGLIVNVSKAVDLIDTLALWVLDKYRRMLKSEFEVHEPYRTDEISRQALNKIFEDPSNRLLSLGKEEFERVLKLQTEEYIRLGSTSPTIWDYLRAG